jgi:hypothetical protein
MQMRKHLICNHCGGRFGTVAHRWCGNKFCRSKQGDIDRFTLHAREAALGVA